MVNDPYENLRSFLEKMKWPSIYAFKFIGKEEDIRRSTFAEGFVRQAQQARREPP